MGTSSARSLAAAALLLAGILPGISIWRWSSHGVWAERAESAHLHHKYFEVNYGAALIPLDHWFGTWHDGSPKGEAAMRERQRRRLKRTAVRPSAETITGKVVAP